jgi:prevent-host-death family protein
MVYTKTSQTSQNSIKTLEPEIRNMTKTKTRKNGAVWQLQEAKAMLSEVIKASFAGPQIITLRGEETAAVLSIGEYRRLTRPREGIVEFIRNSPLFGTELELPPDQPVVFPALFGGSPGDGGA